MYVNYIKIYTVSKHRIRINIIVCLELRQRGSHKKKKKKRIKSSLGKGVKYSKTDCGNGCAAHYILKQKKKETPNFILK